jgi:hypothetical protein
MNSYGTFEIMTLLLSHIQNLHVDSYDIIVSKLKLKNSPISNEVCKRKIDWNPPHIYF